MKINTRKILVISGIVLSCFLALAVLAVIVALPFKQTQFFILRAKNSNTPSEQKIENYQKFVERYPDYVAPRIKVALFCTIEYYRWQGDLSPKEEKYLDLAIEQYRKILAIDPRNVDALLMLSGIYKSEGDLKKVITLNEQVVELEPENASHRTKLARAFLLDKQLEKAKEQAKEALKYDDKNASARLILVNTLAVEGKFPEAIRECLETLTLLGDEANKEQQAEVHAGLAQLYLRTGLIYFAVEEFEKAILLDPESPNYYIDLALAYRRAGLFDKCISVISTSPIMNPETSRKPIPIKYKVNAFMILGDVYLRKGDFIAAKAYFKKSEAYGVTLKKDLMEELEVLSKKQQDKEF